MERDEQMADDLHVIRQFVDEVRPILVSLVPLLNSPMARIAGRMGKKRDSVPFPLDGNTR